MRAVRELTGGAVDIAVVLGSGLGDFADSLDLLASACTEEIPGYPPSTVPGHAGRLLLADAHGHRLLLFQGRIHGYEGHAFADTTLPARIASACKARLLLVTNAAGGLDPAFSAGDLMLITDLLIMPTVRPLHHGAADVALPLPRPLFDMELLARMRHAAIGAGVPLREGTYGYSSGPSYETRAEIAFLRLAGAQAVGMSTAPEILAACRASLPVLALSCITNVARTVPQRISHEEVTLVAGRTSSHLERLLHFFLKEL
jgi:purine-nucleoside phosphorylase